MINRQTNQSFYPLLTGRENEKREKKEAKYSEISLLPPNLKLRQNENAKENQN